MNNSISERLRKVYINLDNDGDECDSCDDIASAIAEIERLTSELEQANDIRDTWRIWLEMMRDSLGIEGTLQQRVFEDMLEAIEQAKAAPVGVPEPTAHVFPDDVERLASSECAVTAYSVEQGHPDRGETVPLYAAPPAKTIDKNEIGGDRS